VSAGRRATLPAALFLGLAAAGSLACGKKADPQPPLPRGPRAVSDLSVEQEGAEAVLTFSYPDRLLTGLPLTDLASIEVFRVVGAGPALTEPRGGPVSGQKTDEAPGAAARRAAQAARQAEETFYREAGSVALLPASALGEHSRGASVVYRDPLGDLLARAGAAPLAYAVVSVRRNGEMSPLSNIATLSPDVPPGAPRIDAIFAEEGRICLDWTPPEKDLLGQPARVGGYFVYRRFAAEPEYDRPLTPSPVAGTSYVDTAIGYGSSYVYTLRATLPDKPRVEGPPAEEAPVDYRDRYPPPAPAALDALSESDRVRLVWDPVASPDLAGYLVFRAQGDGAPERLTERPIPEPFYTDSSVPAGSRYRYTVRAVDAAGNVGPPSPEAVAEPF
jgi:hypothetical protein